MAIYTGQVLPNTDDDFPYMAVISDDQGNVVAEYPARTMADGEAKIVEVIADLKKSAVEEPNA